MARNPRLQRPLTVGGPLGPRGVRFLRRVRDAGGVYLMQLNADREAAGRAIVGGYVRRVGTDPDLVSLTAEGADYLDRLMRVE